ncbi:hypothetical protein MNBD_ALPHA05-532 [hydrothermal vent metagenome]|uniref:Uncharacterized protein n=1 Tax=hydrothermal vent metagenome TaxID=652676 RepID=A0A3B0SQK1_9ZZZZ
METSASDTQILRRIPVLARHSFVQRSASAELRVAITFVLIVVPNIAKGADHHPDIPEHENQQPEKDQEVEKGHHGL